MSLVLWSGGLDSTLMLYDLALRSEATPVRSLGVNYEHVGGNKRFAAARKALLAAFERKGLQIVHSEIELSFSNEDTYMQLGDGGIIQPVIWLSFAQLVLMKAEDLYLGYVRGDDLWRHHSEVTTIFNAAQSMTGKTGKLQFPLEYERKHQIIERLQKLELLSLCAWCESTSDSLDPCGNCASCEAHEQGLWRLERERERRPKPSTVGCYKTDTVERAINLDDKMAEEPVDVCTSVDCSWTVAIP